MMLSPAHRMESGTSPRKGCRRFVLDLSGFSYGFRCGFGFGSIPSQVFAIPESVTMADISQVTPPIPDPKAGKPKVKSETRAVSA
jgi:hypothetical protein